MPALNDGSSSSTRRRARRRRARSPRPRRTSAAACAAARQPSTCARRARPARRPRRRARGRPTRRRPLPTTRSHRASSTRFGCRLMATHDSAGPRRRAARPAEASRTSAGKLARRGRLEEHHARRPRRDAAAAGHRDARRGAQALARRAGLRAARGAAARGASAARRRRAPSRSPPRRARAAGSPRAGASRRRADARRASRRRRRARPRARSTKRRPPTARRSRARAAGKKPATSTARDSPGRPRPPERDERAAGDRGQRDLHARPPERLERARLAPSPHRRERAPHADRRAHRRQRQRAPRPLAPGDAALVGRRRDEPGQREREPRDNGGPREDDRIPAGHPQATVHAAQTLAQPAPRGETTRRARSSGRRRAAACYAACNVALGPHGPEMVRRRSTAAVRRETECPGTTNRKHSLGSAGQTHMRQAHECRPSAGGGRTSCKVPMALVREGSCRRSLSVRVRARSGARPVQRGRSGRPRARRDTASRAPCSAPPTCPFAGPGTARVDESHPGRCFSAAPGPVDTRRPAGSYFTLLVAGLAQLVERRLPKPKVASSKLVSRSRDRLFFAPVGRRR